MPETTPILISEPNSVQQDKSSHTGVFNDFLDHFSVDRISTEVTFAKVLREHHPNYHIICTTPGTIDLGGFASAGNAEIITEDDETKTDATRMYIPSVMRLASSPGKLENHYRFCRHRYTWETHTFIWYEILYQDQYARDVHLNFLLSPKHEGSTKEGFNSLLDKLILAVGHWTKELHEEIYVFDNGVWSKNHQLWSSVQDSTWDDVILDPVMKGHLIADVQGFFDNQELYKKLSVPWKRGLIIHGVPGNGKTISIKALINSLSERPDPVPSLYVKSLKNCNGPQYAIRSIFSKARKMAPCLLILEDLDSLITDKTRSYFLNEVDGLESNNGILMIGSTNHLNSLDPAISKRPSRFDRKYHFRLPRELEREAYCRFWRKKLVATDLVEFPEDICGLIAKMTEGFSFAYLKELFLIVLLTIARGRTGDEEEEESEPSKTPEPVSEEETSSNNEETSSSDGHVVVEHTDAASDIQSSGKAIATVITTQIATPIKKRVMPQVAVPAHLKDNVLLKVTMSQVSLLLEEMDNTEEEEEKKKRVAEALEKAAPGVPPPYQVAGMMARPMRTIRAVPMQ